MRHVILVTCALLVGVCASASVTTGCEGCDLEHVCAINNNDLVVSKVGKMCGVDPTGTGATRTWTTGGGSCTCDLTSEGAFSQHFLRNCTFKAGSGSGSGTGSGSHS